MSSRRENDVDGTHSRRVARGQGHRAGRPGGRAVRRQSVAQFGAEVIKIEAPGEGDPLRRWRKLHNGTSLWWYSQSRNKKSLTLNLKSEKGRKVARALVKDADVLVENFRPGTLEGWGLGWDELSTINSRLVMVRISGYGQTGPYRDRPGFAAIAEAMGGLRYVTGYPDRAPVRVGVSIGDTLASLYAVVGALIALRHRDVNGGTGQVVDVALYEAVFAVMESLIPEFSRFGFVRERSGGSLPGIAPSNTYPCGDGGYVVIAGNSDRIFKRLMHAIGRADLAADPALARNDGRVEQIELIDAAISGWTAQRGLEEVLGALERADVPVGRIYSAADIPSRCPLSPARHDRSGRAARRSRGRPFGSRAAIEPDARTDPLAGARAWRPRGGGAGHHRRERRGAVRVACRTDRLNHTCTIRACRISFTGCCSNWGRTPTARDWCVRRCAWRKRCGF